MEDKKEISVSTLIGQSLVPCCALVVYSSEHSETYLETRQFKEDGSLGAGTPVTRSFVASLAKAVSGGDDAVPHGPMPGNILYADYRTGIRKLIFWEPPQERQMYFGKNLGIKDGSFLMPGIVYAVSGNSLYVYAFKGRKPQMRHKLLFFPSFNQYADHRICLGSADVKRSGEMTWSAELDYWRAMFWQSVNESVMSPGVKDGVVFTNEIKKAAEKPFDIGVMKGAGKTLDALVKKF